MIRSILKLHQFYSLSKKYLKCTCTTLLTTTPPCYELCNLIFVYSSSICVYKIYNTTTTCIYCWSTYRAEIVRLSSSFLNRPAAIEEEHMISESFSPSYKRDMIDLCAQQHVHHHHQFQSQSKLSYASYNIFCSGIYFYFSHSVYMYNHRLYTVVV